MEKITVDEALEYIQAKFPDAEIFYEDDGMLLGVMVNLNLVLDPNALPHEEILVSPDDF